ncbi:hypothetical protein DSL72_008236 [Monilinia vaccinii-corymbosi]|uniref:2EXR domain-containing protein n=1 Tax=Monilinia vaccinii-corymbosi TaxID=61207 RepID=A0A8A3PKE3_9HELO|nr:hypothetical protein DSL72_008236 [Monilinia vaccinii-corymbosi]
MADFDFPGVDLSDPFVPFAPSPTSVSTYSPFECSTSTVAVKPAHDYSTFTHSTTPEHGRPSPVSLALRSQDFSSNHPPSLSFSRTSSTSTNSSLSSPTSNLIPNRLSSTKWKPLTSFPHFTSLPLDIQRNIWRHTLPGPQIIEIYQYPTRTPRLFSSSSTTTATRQEQDILPLLRTYIPLPIALHINRLSRRLALLHLTPLSFAHPYYLPSNPYAYIDYTYDTIFLSFHTLYPDLGNNILYSRDLHKIRYLAVEFNVWCDLLEDNHFVNALFEMEALVSIDIVFEKREISASSNTYRSCSSSTVSTRPGDSIMHWGNARETTNTLDFIQPTEEERIELEDLFQRECQNIWWWGRVSGWEDVMRKLRLMWKEGDSQAITAIPIPSRTHRASGCFTSGSGIRGSTKMGYEELRGLEVDDSASRRGFEDGLGSLMSRVDDVIMDYGYGYEYGVQGGGEWDDVTCGCGGGGEGRVCGESGYYASFDDDSDLEGWT